MTDLTEITTPYGLLDEATQDALRAHGGPYECFDSDGKWVQLSLVSWWPHKTYRVKPHPCEWWAIIDGDRLVEIYQHKSEAEKEAEDIPGARIRIIREVLE